MTPEDIKPWLDMIQAGGNGAMIAGVYIGYRIYKSISTKFTRLEIRLARIEAAIRVDNPAAARILDSAHEPEENSSAAA